MSDPNVPESEVPLTPPPAAQAPSTPPAAGAPAPASPYGTPDPGPAAPPSDPYAAPPAAPYGAAAQPPLTPENDRQLAMWAHIGGVVGFLPSLIIWLMFKDRGPVTAVEAKEALNWQITFTIFYVAAIILTSVLSGFLWMLGPILGLIPLAVWVLNVVWSIMGGMRVNSGGAYRYPVNFRFLK